MEAELVVGQDGDIADVLVEVQLYGFVESNILCSIVYGSTFKGKRNIFVFSVSGTVTGSCSVSAVGKDR